MRQRWLRHYGEMVAAMVLSMVLLEPLRMAIAQHGWLPGESVGPVALPLVMATEMSLGMGVWMRVRGHAGSETLEMCAAMYASFAVCFPLLWLGVLSGEAVLLIGHLLMLGAMALLAHRHAVVPGRSAPFSGAVGSNAAETS